MRRNRIFHAAELMEFHAVELVPFQSQNASTSIQMVPVRLAVVFVAKVPMVVGFEGSEAYYLVSTQHMCVDTT